MRHSIKTYSFLLLLTFFLTLNCFSDTEIEKARKLAQEGNPELAIKSLDSLLNSDPDNEKLNKALSDFELQVAETAQGFSGRLEHIKRAIDCNKKVLKTIDEKIDFNYAICQLGLNAIKELEVTEENKKQMIDIVLPLFDQAISNCILIIARKKSGYEKFIAKAMSETEEIYVKSVDGRGKMEEFYLPYVASNLKYFECVVEKENLLFNSGKPLTVDLNKLFVEAKVFCEQVESPIPSSTICLYVGRAYGLLAKNGTNPKENLDKAKEKLMGILAIENLSVREIKIKAIFELIDLAMHFEDYPSALAAVDFITKDNKFNTMPIEDKFTTVDLEILLYGILVNAKAYKKSNNENERLNYRKNINNIESKITLAIPHIKNSNSWAIKLKAYLKEANVIMGK